MDTLSGRRVWAFMSRRLPRPTGARNHGTDVFYDASPYDYSVHVTPNAIEVYPSDRYVNASHPGGWPMPVVPGSQNVLNVWRTATARWPAAVAKFVNANEPAFRALDEHLSRGDELMKTKFFDRVATELDPNVLVINQPRLSASDRDAVVELQGPFERSGAGRKWTVILWGRVTVEVIMNTSIAIPSHSFPEQTLRSGPIFEAVNRLCRVLLDAPAGPREVRYSDAEWDISLRYRFYDGDTLDTGRHRLVFLKYDSTGKEYAEPPTKDRRLPDAAVPLIETLRQLFWTAPARINDLESSVAPIPDVAFVYFDGHVETVRAANLVMAPTGDTDATATAKLLGLDYVGDDDVSAFYALDDERPLRTIGDLVTALAERGPDPTSFLVTFIPPPPSPPPAASLASGFCDRAIN